MSATIQSHGRSCQGCGRPSVAPLLDLGEQPVTNRFLTRADSMETVRSLILAQCPDCALVQLGSPWAAADLQPQVDWISYREPEDHLDELVAEIVKLPSVTPGSSICGITVKDDSTLERFQRRGFSRTWRVDMARDIGIADRRAGVETLQEKLTPDVAKVIALSRGPADLVFIRHVVEHAHDLPRFLRSLRTLMTPRGYLVIEVPDCSDALQRKDYTTVWEEHSIYFTPATFVETIRHAGFDLVRQFCYRYPFENSLAFVLRIADGAGVGTKSAGDHAAEIARGREFGAAFVNTKRALRRTLTELLQGRKGALFGAGHLACAFVNYHDLGDLFAFVVDDNPHKQGLFLPGSRLPIQPSAALEQGDLALALTCFAPENEDKVIAKNRAFTDRGGRFLSIFPSSTRAIQSLFDQRVGA